MEKNEISTHELSIYKIFRINPLRWLSNKEAAELAKANNRTTRAHTLKLVKMGVLDQAEVFPAHKYRLSAFADKRNGGYVRRLETAAEVLGVSLTA